MAAKKKSMSKSERTARDKRIAKSKAKINELVDKGMPFNPQTASQHLIDRAVANKTEQSGSRNLSGTRSGSIEGSEILVRTTNSARAPKRTSNKKKKG
jgi:hypothetical protein